MTPLRFRAWDKNGKPQPERDMVKTMTEASKNEWRLGAPAKPLRDTYTKEEEQEWRMALLYYLELPNLGNKGADLTWEEFNAKQYHLRNRFT